MDDRALIDLALARLADIPEKTLRLLFGHLRRDHRFADARRVLETLTERTGETGTILDSRADLFETRRTIGRGPPHPRAPLRALSR